MMGKGAKANQKGILQNRIGILICLIPLLGGFIFCLIRLLNTISNPVRIYHYSPGVYLLVTMLMIAFLTAFTAIVIVIVRKKELLTGRGSLIAVCFLSGISAVVLAVLAVISFNTARCYTGVVKIASPEELEYLHHYPSGHYELTEDITMGGEWQTVKYFSGELNGGGHTISGLTLGENGFIKTNEGTIRDLSLSDVEYKDFDVYCDYGSLTALNKGTVSGCKMIPGEENGGQTSSPCALFLIGVNEGKCTDCPEKPLKDAADKVNHRLELEKETKATCQKEGSLAYRCSACGFSATEKTPVIDHVYEESERKEPECIHDGHITYTCTMCGDSYTDQLAATGVHSYKIVTYTADRNHLLCEYCGEGYYGYRAEPFNWKFFLLLGMLIAAGVVTVILIKKMRRRHERRIRIIGTVVCSVLAVLIGFHFFLAFRQPNGKDLVDSILVSAPDSKCSYKATKKIKPGYTHIGTVTYTCQDCGKEHTESIPKLEPETDWTKLKSYDDYQFKNADKCASKNAKHYYEVQLLKKAPTETEDGEYVFACRDCGRIIESHPIPHL